jgi:hypothetical protein
LTARELGAGATANVTGTATAIAPVALNVIAPLYVPAARDPVATLTVRDPFPEPEAGLRESHGALSLAVQVRVPPPVLLMLSA